MITLEDGLTLCGRCVCGYEVGYIIKITPTMFVIRWRDGDTTQLRPDLFKEEEAMQAAE